MKNREEKHFFLKASLLNKTLIILISKPIKKKKNILNPNVLPAVYMHFNTSLYLIYLQLFLGKDYYFYLF